MTEEEIVGWHHQLDGHGFGWTLGVGDGQGGLGSISGLGRSPGERKGYPLQYSGLKNIPWTVLSVGLQSIGHD